MCEADACEPNLVWSLIFKLKKIDSSVIVCALVLPIQLPVSDVAEQLRDHLSPPLFQVFGQQVGDQYQFEDHGDPTKCCGGYCQGITTVIHEKFLNRLWYFHSRSLRGKFIVGIQYRPKSFSFIILFCQFHDNMSCFGSFTEITALRVLTIYCL